MDSLGYPFAVIDGVAHSPRGTRRVPWSGDAIHYGSALVRGGELVKPSGEVYKTYDAVLIPYGFRGGEWVDARYALGVEGEWLEVVDLATWRVVASMECSQPWITPSQPFSDAKFAICLDGITAWVDPNGYGFSAAPCPDAIYPDPTRPYTVLGVRLGERGVEGDPKQSYVVIRFDARGGFVERFDVSAKGVVEPVGVVGGVFTYVESLGDSAWLVMGRRRIELGTQLIASSSAVVMGRKAISPRGEGELECEPVVVGYRHYICVGDGHVRVLELPTHLLPA